MRNKLQKSIFIVLILSLAILKLGIDKRALLKDSPVCSEKQRIPCPRWCLAGRGWSLIAALPMNVQESMRPPPLEMEN